MNTRFLNATLAGLLINTSEEGERAALNVSTASATQTNTDVGTQFIVAAVCLGTLAALVVLYRANDLPRACSRFSLFGRISGYESITDDLDTYPEAVPLTLIPKLDSTTSPTRP